MSSLGRIWVDHSNPVLRHGIVGCLREASHDVAGSGAGLRPVPDLAGVSLLIFDIEGSGVDRAVALARGRDLRLVGLFGGPGSDGLRDLQRAGLSAVLGTTALTPSRLLTCIQAVQRLPGPPSRPRRMLVGTSPPCAARFTPREIDVLRLLADGATTRDIAQRMNYSERTVKHIVHDVLVKLRGRTRAHAVAVAARSGVI
ncbi:helix-turn-helix transcriptional regulator [Baekduia soli]|nr:LuxR C-terminal-related transcriptional regulator [Baekduia soli]